MPHRGHDYRPGERVPGTVYVVVRLIGTGGMGTVYEVEDTTIEKRYVLKTLHPQLGEREDLARRMQKEARQLARLNHANIVEVITAGVTGDEARLPYYVMERLNGQSLRVVLETKGQLKLPHAYHIGIDLLDALDHAHGKGVIHRDVKPDNIFLHRTSAGVTITKLLDFGILSLLDATVRETAGRFLGTLRYSAPEQLRGETPTPQVDVYAAGLVLYEMIAGRGPFDDEGDPHAIGAAHMDKPPPSLSLFVGVQPELEALVMAALAKAPEDRPRDAFSFATSLRELKRALVGSRPRESTENRGAAAPMREQLPPAQTSLPKTTIRGVAAPTLGPPLLDPSSYARTATTPEAMVDRMAPTNSYVPHAVASPRHGTEVLPIVARDAARPCPLPTPPSSASPKSSDAPVSKWPLQHAAAISDEPHAQTLTVHAPRASRSAALVAATVAMLALATAGAVLVVVRHPPSGPERRSSMQEGALGAMHSLPARLLTPVPGPTTPPTPSGARDEGAVVREKVNSPPAPVSSSARSKPRAPSGVAPAKLDAAAQRSDRPGPSF